MGELDMQAPSRLILGQWGFNPRTGMVFYAGQPIASMTWLEAQILSLLFDAYPEPVTRQEIIERLTTSRWSVKVLIHRMRAKLGHDFIITMRRRYGYSLNPDALPLHRKI